MSEMVSAYSRENFPIAGILEDLTAEVKDKGWEPLEAYMAFEAQLALHGLQRRILDYGSTSITTGGHARIPGQQMAEVIEANTRTAREIILVLQAAGAIEANEMLLSVDLGNTRWNQVQFMSYWLLTNAGPNLHEIARRPMGITSFEHEIAQSIRDHGVDLAIMGDSRVEREIRRPEYMKFSAANAVVMQRSDVPRVPVRRFLSLVDTGISIGCDAERDFAVRMEIPRFNVTPVRPASVDELPIPRLREDLRIIQAHGGEVFVAAAGSMLTLLRAQDYH